MSVIKVGLFIPTFNAVSTCGDNYKQTLQIIHNAKLNDVLIIDSTSNDETLAITQSFGFKCMVIPQAEFDHGGTRQLALELLKDNDIIVYLTQDALLHNPDSITKLIQPLIDNANIAGVYGRQLPHSNADTFAKHLRDFNYKPKSYVCGYNDRIAMGMKTIFSSDSFAAYSVKALNQIGGFPHHLILGEDVYIFATLLQHNFKVAYVGDAICYHSHNYTLAHEFKRYFDIGVFHQMNNWILQDFGYPNKLGVRYILSEFRFLGLRVWLFPILGAKITAKYLGYKLGCNYYKIGVKWCKRLTMNKQFWRL